MHQLTRRTIVVTLSKRVGSGRECQLVVCRVVLPEGIGMTETVGRGRVNWIWQISGRFPVVVGIFVPICMVQLS